MITPDLSEAINFVERLIRETEAHGGPTMRLDEYIPELRRVLYAAQAFADMTGMDKPIPAPMPQWPAPHQPLPYRGGLS